MNATRPQVRMEVLLHTGILSFDHFEVYMTEEAQMHDSVYKI
jgi:S-adenosylmethionine:tRNA-ribosyltransferase-isomerase (queuine synthetase)